MSWSETLHWGYLTEKYFFADMGLLSPQGCILDCSGAKVGEGHKRMGVAWSENVLEACRIGPTALGGAFPPTTSPMHLLCPWFPPFRHNRFVWRVIWCDHSASSFFLETFSSFAPQVLARFSTPIDLQQRSGQGLERDSSNIIGRVRQHIALYTRCH